MKNTGDAIGDFDGTKYPLATCSDKNLQYPSLPALWVTQGMT